ASNWHPLTWLSHMIDVEIYGLDPGGHHGTNLFFHILNTVLLFLILTRMTGAPGKSGIVAALFAFHPLHVESVAWVAERKDVLSTFFLFLMLGAYALYVERPGRWKYGIALVFFALGLMAKPMLVSAPFLLLLLDVWPLRRRPVPDRPPSKMEKIPFFALAVLSSGITLYAQASGGAMRSLEAIPLADRAANALVSAVTYMGKMFWPAGLSVFYPYPAAIPFWKVLGAAALLVLITVFVFREKARRPWFFTGWLWYLISLFPVIGIVQVGPQSMADRYTYIPLIGLFIALTWAVDETLSRRRFPVFASASLVLILLAGLSSTTWFQLSHWKNSRSLFTHALEVTENNALAHNNLAVALADDGEREAAVNHFQEAIRVNPRHFSAHFNLANHLVALGRGDQAVFHYREAIRFNPGYTAAHNNLGVVLLRQGNLEGAEAHLLEALKHGPVKEGMLFNMAMIFVSRGENEKAAQLLREALEVNAGYAEAHNLLGVVYMKEGRKGEAAESFRRALSCDPGLEAARLNLKAIERD
ncbi:MAG TPA: tetratricopeptide repeat protein, partial [Syntrophales bacterium]|nr:tetratricopeptide repeat protein [Syntrophales bacterium]